MPIASTARPAKVNLAGPDPDECQEHGEFEYGGRDKDVSGGEQVADKTHDPGCSKAADRCKALIAIEPFSERIVPDQPQADGSDPRPENTSGRALEDASGEDRWKVRPQREDQCRQSYRGSPDADQRPFRRDRVEEFASWHLG